MEPSRSLTVLPVWQGWLLVGLALLFVASVRFLPKAEEFIRWRLRQLGNESDEAVEFHTLALIVAWCILAVGFAFFGTLILLRVPLETMPTTPGS